MVGLIYLRLSVGIAAASGKHHAFVIKAYVVYAVAFLY